MPSVLTSRPRRLGDRTAVSGVLREVDLYNILVAGT